MAFVNRDTVPPLFVMDDYCITPFDISHLPVEIGEICIQFAHRVVKSYVFRLWLLFACCFVVSLLVFSFRLLVVFMMRTAATL